MNDRKLIFLKNLQISIKFVNLYECHSSPKFSCKIPLTMLLLIFNFNFHIFDLYYFVINIFMIFFNLSFKFFLQND
jgi:hypothetical protein